jgi:pSer/pThr/pTyr-binding forkhead associated (FHA) protein
LEGAIAMEPVLVLRRNGGVVIRLRPGERRLIGRAPASDLVLGHPSVSRLHARLAWPPGRARPVVEDLQSANGVRVNGRRVAQLAELRDGARVGIGDLELCAELVEDAPPALLDDDTVRVRLFDERGSERRGRLAGAAALRDLLLEIEDHRRTGTLALPGAEAQVTFARGRIIDAAAGLRRGAEALDALLGRDEALDY